jgi:hypothetical protein
MLSGTKWVMAVLSAIAVALVAPIDCQAGNLVTNGSFEINTGIGQIGFNTTVAGWTTAGWPSSYDFLLSPKTVDLPQSQWSHAAHGAVGQVALWGPRSGVSNGLAASPDGGFFVGLNGDFVKTTGKNAGNHDGPISQTIAGLTIGHQYQLGFDWAAAQQIPFRGATLQYLQVSLGPQTHDTSTFSLASQGFSGWMAATMDFTATSTTEVLSFLAVGNKPIPPFSLLDGVTLVDTTASPGGNPGGRQTPEPSTLLASLLSFGMFGAIWAFKRIRKPVVAA